MSSISCNPTQLLPLQNSMSSAVCALVIIHPSLAPIMPALDVLRSILAPCVVKTMHEPLLDEEQAQPWSHILLCAPSMEGDSVFAWLETNSPLISRCSEVGFVEFGNGPAEDTWLLDQRFWQLTTTSIPLADRFDAEDVVRAKDFARAFKGE